MTHTHTHTLYTTVVRADRVEGLGLIRFNQLRTSFQGANADFTSRMVSSFL